jgi:chaperonin GroEL
VGLRSSKRVLFGRTARNAVSNGLTLASRLASVTHGPRGGLVAVEQTNDYPFITNNGFGAIRHLSVADNSARLGVELLKDLVSRVHYELGDGTSTTSILADAFSSAATQLLAAGNESNAIIPSFDAAEDIAIEALSGMRREVSGREMLAHLALRAGGDDREMAELVAEAVDRVGPEGVVTVSYHQAVSSCVDYASGMEFDSGVINRDFLDEKGKLRLERPLLLLSEDKIEEPSSVIPALEIARAAARSLLVIAEGVEKQALATLLANHRAGLVRCAAVKGPGSGIYRREMTADIAILCGGSVFGRRLGRMPETAGSDDLGQCELVTTNGQSTRIHEVAGSRDAVAARVLQLKDAHAAEQRHYDRSKLALRLARLSSEVANIRVGAFTESEWNIRYRRTENMVSVAQSAVSGGTVPGGGVALLWAAERVKEAIGSDPAGTLYARALRSPFNRIVEAAGLVPRAVAESLRNSGTEAAFDQRLGKVVTGEAAECLVDSLPVVGGALRVASSIAKQVAKIGCAVVTANSR